LILTTFARVAVDVDLEQADASPQLLFCLDAQVKIGERTLRLLGRVKPFPQYVHSYLADCCSAATNPDGIIELEPDKDGAMGRA
jgi:hypothetical protein